MGYVRGRYNYIRRTSNVLFWEGFGWAAAVISRIFFVHKTKRTHVMGVGLRISRVFGPRK